MNSKINRLSEIKRVRNQKEIQARLEADKLRYDLLKHITTLSTGSIVITGGLVKNILNDPGGFYFLLISFFFLFVSVLSSLYAMLIKTHQVQIAGPLKRRLAIFLAKFSSSISFIAFVLGIFFVGIFFVFNISTVSESLVPNFMQSTMKEARSHNSRQNKNKENRVSSNPSLETKNLPMKKNDCGNVTN